MKLLIIFLIFQSKISGLESNSSVLLNNPTPSLLNSQVKHSCCCLPFQQMIGLCNNNIWPTMRPRPPRPTRPGPTQPPRPPITTESFQDPIGNCGKRNGNNRIVGGNNAEQGEFPWRCNLYNPLTKQPFCACSILSKIWIITAAHCTLSISSTLSMKINVGDHNIHSNSESPNQAMYSIRTVINHPAYNDSTKDNDISLIQLQSPLRYSRDVSPICLPCNLKNFDISGQTGVLSGWGRLSSGGALPSILQKVEMPMLTTNKCKEFLGSSITDNMICALAPNKDSCQGDSGGSMDMKDKNNQYNAMGIVSWGFGCARPGYPGAYTKVTNYLNWIETASREKFCKSS